MAMVLDVLDRLADWQVPDALAAALGVPEAALQPMLAGLLALDLIEIEGTEASCGGPVSDGAWSGWPPIARLFHDATRDVPWGEASASTDAPPAGPPPPTVLPDIGGDHVPLPLPRLRGSLQHALAARRTWRRFSDRPLTRGDLGTLLGVTFGIQAWAIRDGQPPLALKTSPSGGARHSIEAYCWVRRVRGVAPGLYHYRGDRHALTRLAEAGQADAPVVSWLPAQPGYEGAAVVVAMTTVLERVTWRYRRARGYRVVLIEAGHLAQTFCLCATALGLAPFCSAALADSGIEASLGVSSDQQPVVYVVGAGYPAAGPWRPHADRPAPELERTPLGHALGGGLSHRATAPRRPPRRGRAR